jgi:hypothetical protein
MSVLPAERIDALVCGLPAHERQRRLLMILQGYFDDSGTSKGQFVCVIAGFISTVERWKSFSEEWQAKLNEDPKLAYFRMSDAMGLRGQFERSWNPELRDQRVYELLEIIKKHSIIAVESRLLRGFYENLVRGISPVFDDPYFLTIMQLIFAVYHWQIVHNHSECDLIFDEQGDLSKHLMALWPTIKDSIRRDATYPDTKAEDWLELLKHPPIFRDDRKFLPLQAADMFAWSVHDTVFCRSLDLPELSRIVLQAVTNEFGKIETISRNWSFEEITKIGARLLLS